MALKSAKLVLLFVLAISLDWIFGEGFLQGFLIGKLL